jgi:single-strand DNA-binding protein
MASLNDVTLMGNLTRDPELRYTANDKPVVNLGLAINDRWNDEHGEPQERTTFVDVTAWGKTAENTAQYLRKGSPALVKGRLQVDEWDDAGTTRRKMFVVADRVVFLNSAPAKAASSERAGK